MNNSWSPSLKSIEAARAFIRPSVGQTPMVSARCPKTQAEFFLKLESMHRTGSFKERGACFRLGTLQRAEGAQAVVATSAGNHSQALSYHGKRLGFEVHICMPKTAPTTKVRATEQWGAKVQLLGESFSEAMEHGKALAHELRAPFISAFDDPFIISGQGTAGLEILEQCPDLEQVLVPIGGGGLASGISMAIKERKPDCHIIGIQSENCPWVSKKILGEKVPEVLRHRNTIADGIAIKTLGDITIPIMQKYLDELILVSEHQIAMAVMHLMEHGRIIAEGAGAVGVSAILAGKVDVQKRKTVVLMSGGNIDLSLLALIIRKGMTFQQRTIRLKVLISDRPGGLFGLTGVLASMGASILQVQHERAAEHIPMYETSVELRLETKGTEHADKIEEKLRSEGYRVERLPA